MIDITKHLLGLPRFVMYQGIEFQFRLFINASDEIRICYEFEAIYPQYVPEKYLKSFENGNGWHNPLLFDEPYYCNFLWLYEGIANDADMIKAIHDCGAFLTKHKLNDKD